MYRVHGYVNNRLRINKTMEHIPKRGDTVRLSEEEYAIVNEIIWCMDEGSQEGQRINIRMEYED